MIYVVATPKGGVGKSTTAAELVLAMIDGAPPETVVMEMRLVERASV